MLRKFLWKGNRHIIAGQLGRGGMGEVYRATGGEGQSGKDYMWR